jgi:mannose-6-phosphate isomerase-like protein (cupin superfamily)
MPPSPDKVTLTDKLARITEPWSPKIVAELNGQYVKLVKFQGEFVWHRHDHEDELFMVLEGSIVIQFRDRDVTLRKGELIVVPKGVEHRPVAAHEAQVMLFEPKSTLNTGNVRDALTREHIDWV